MKAYSEVFAVGYPHTITTDNGAVLRIDARHNIKATLSGVGTIEVLPWGRGLHNLLADHASGSAPLDGVEFWLDNGDTQERVVLEFDHRGDWGCANGRAPEALRQVMRAIYAQARGED